MILNPIKSDMSASGAVWVVYLWMLRWAHGFQLCFTSLMHRCAIPSHACNDVACHHSVLQTILVGVGALAHVQLQMVTAWHRNHCSFRTSFADAEATCWKSKEIKQRDILLWEHKYRFWKSTMYAGVVLSLPYAKLRQLARPLVES